MRFVIEDTCEHGNVKCAALGFIYDTSTGKQRRICPGGSRTVLDGIPEEWVRKAALEVENQMDNEIDWSGNVDFVAVARAVLESVLGQ